MYAHSSDHSYQPNRPPPPSFISALGAGVIPGWAGESLGAAETMATRLNDSSVEYIWLRSVDARCVP